MSEIEKISEEKNLQSQKISQLEQNIQKSSKLLIIHLCCNKYIYIYFYLRIRKKCQN